MQTLEPVRHVNVDGRRADPQSWKPGPGLLADGAPVFCHTTIAGVQISRSTTRVPVFVFTDRRHTTCN